MSTPEENKELVERASFEVFNEGNTDLLDEVVTDDYVLHDAASPETIRGRDAFREYVETYRDAFPDLNATIDSIITEENLVAVRFTVRGTHEGPLPDVPELEPTGKEVEVVGMEFDRIENGRIAETWQVYDALGLLRQLGAFPSEEFPTET